MIHGDGGVESLPADGEGIFAQGVPSVCQGEVHIGGIRRHHNALTGLFPDGDVGPVVKEGLLVPGIHHPDPVEEEPGVLGEEEVPLIGDAPDAVIFVEAEDGGAVLVLERIGEEGLEGGGVVAPDAEIVFPAACRPGVADSQTAGAHIGILVEEVLLAVLVVELPEASPAGGQKHRLQVGILQGHRGEIGGGVAPTVDIHHGVGQHIPHHALSHPETVLRGHLGDHLIGGKETQGRQRGTGQIPIPHQRIHPCLQEGLALLYPHRCIPFLL